MLLLIFLFQNTFDYLISFQIGLIQNFEIFNHLQCSKKICYIYCNNTFSMLNFVDLILYVFKMTGNKRKNNKKELFQVDGTFQ